MSKRLFSFLVLIFFVLSTNSAYAQEKPAPKISEEAKIGDMIHAQIMSSFHPYTEPRAVEYINHIGDSIAAHAERKKLNYQFIILYNDRIYATSSPGGYVYVTTGMINFLQNESELAGVLAHEVGELQYQDPRLSKSKKVLESITRNGAMVAPAFGQIGALAALGLAMLNKTVDPTQKSPEEKLAKADKKALHYMVDAGYDPQAFLDLQFKFLNAGPELQPLFYDYYQSRPITMKRWNGITKTFEHLSLEGKSFSTNHETYMEMTKGIREIYLPQS